MTSIYRISRLPPILFLKNVIFRHSFLKTYFRGFQTSNLGIYLLLSILPIWCHHIEDILKHRNLDIISFMCCYLCAQYISILLNPVDYSPSGSSVHEILQARILEWVAFPAPGDLPDPGIEPISLGSPALAGRFFITLPPGKPLSTDKFICFN